MSYGARRVGKGFPKKTACKRQKKTHQVAPERMKGGAGMEERWSWRDRQGWAEAGSLQALVWRFDFALEEIEAIKEFLLGPGCWDCSRFRGDSECEGERSAAVGGERRQNNSRAIPVTGLRAPVNFYGRKKRCPQSGTSPRGLKAPVTEVGSAPMEGC